MSKVIIRDPEIMGGVPVFRGTRVPLSALFNNLEAGLTVDEIVDAFPTLNKQDVLIALAEAESLLATA